MTKITKTEILSNIRTLLENTDVQFDNPELTIDMAIEFCDKEIAALARKAAKAKETAAAKKAEGDELRDRVQAVLTEDWMAAADVVEAIGDEEVTMGKVIHRLTALINAGVAEKTQATVGEKGSKRKITVYRICVES